MHYIFEMPLTNIHWSRDKCMGYNNIKMLSTAWSKYILWIYSEDLPTKSTVITVNSQENGEKYSFSMHQISTILLLAIFPKYLHASKFIQNISLHLSSDKRSHIFLISLTRWFHRSIKTYRTDSIESIIALYC